MRLIAAWGGTIALVLGLAAAPVDAAGPASSQSSVVASTAQVAAKKAAKKKWRPKQGAFFNRPRAAQPADQWIVERQVLKAINNTKKGQQIRMAIFSFDRHPMADALIAAKRRGVRVQILLNDHQQNSAMYRLYKALGRKPKKNKSFAYRCTKGCRSTFENLHTKFYLFSKTGAARDVVMVGSHNLTANAAINQWNDLYVIRDKPKVYDPFVELFNEMRKDRKAKPQYYKRKLTKKYQLEVLPYPNFSAKNDPMMDNLNKVKCKTAKGAPSGVKGRTMVRVNMHAWNTKRGAWLARKVRQLYAQGCDVKVMYGTASKLVRDEFAKKTPRGALPVHVDGYDTNYDGLIDLYGHLKVLTIGGHWGKDRSARYTWTGSSNWGNSGLRGDEVIFRIKGNTVMRRYNSNFNYMWRNGSHLAKYIDYGRGVSPRLAPPPKPGGPAWEND